MNDASSTAGCVAFLMGNQTFFDRKRLIFLQK
jgi:hypothetical protein